MSLKTAAAAAATGAVKTVEIAKAVIPEATVAGSRAFGEQVPVAKKALELWRTLSPTVGMGPISIGDYHLLAPEVQSVMNNLGKTRNYVERTAFDYGVSDKPAGYRWPHDPQMHPVELNEALRAGTGNMDPAKLLRSAADNTSGISPLTKDALRKMADTWDKERPAIMASLALRPVEFLEKAVAEVPVPAKLTWNNPDLGTGAATKWNAESAYEGTATAAAVKTVTPASVQGAKGGAVQAASVQELTTWMAPDRYSAGTGALLRGATRGAPAAATPTIDAPMAQRTIKYFSDPTLNEKDPAVMRDLVSKFAQLEKSAAAGAVKLEAQSLVNDFLTYGRQWISNNNLAGVYAAVK